jgi:hypothetical protein
MFALLLAILLAPAEPAALQPAADVPLAVEVFEAHGGASWDQVAQIAYTFHVENQGQQLLAAQHVWDVTTGDVAVTMNGQETITNLNQPDDSEAFKRWTNDAYWLIAPLKLLDEGVLARELPPEGDDRRLLVRFDNVGLTPSDEYLYEIDTDGKIVAWTYTPANGQGRRFTWSGYDTFGPLTLALDHETAEGFRVFFTEVSVITQ